MAYDPALADEIRHALAGEDGRGPRPLAPAEAGGSRGLRGQPACSASIRPSTRAPSGNAPGFGPA